MFIGIHHFVKQYSIYVPFDGTVQEFLERKFDPSQIQVILAAEDGGGFTLVESDSEFSPTIQSKWETNERGGSRTWSVEKAERYLLWVYRGEVRAAEKEAE